jgi:hypothetical protein
LVINEALEDVQFEINLAREIVKKIRNIYLNNKLKGNLILDVQTDVIELFDKETELKTNFDLPNFSVLNNIDNLLM